MFICIVDAELLEAVAAEVFKSKDVQHADRLALKHTRQLTIIPGRRSKFTITKPKRKNQTMSTNIGGNFGKNPNRSMTKMPSNTSNNQWPPGKTTIKEKTSAGARTAVTKH